ncbi:MAG: methyltransferase domain-containing protein [Luteitalea sp.]|nr:methyltransferase domain-containing protein [Luteitalea sp.]
MPRALAGYGIFFRQFIQRYHTTGAVMPSGRPLAAALCRYVGGAPGPQRILEVGPGVGAVTMTLVERMRDDDDLCLVEINEMFVAYLQEAFKERPQLRSKAPRVALVHGRVEDLSREGYDLIISGLPLNNFTAPEVDRILHGFARLLKPGGVLSFFEYIAVRSAKTWVSLPKERERLRAVDAVLRRALDATEFRRDWVWPNVPPAWVHHLRF